MRRTAAAIVLALTIVPLYYACWVPWRCGIFAKELESAFQATLKGNPGAQAFLRDNVSRTEAFRKHVPGDASLNIALASTYNLFGRFEEAERVYDRALNYDRRPEMYFNRAGIRLRLGNQDGAYEDFLKAVLFNPDLVNRIKGEVIGERVRSELKRVYGEQFVK